MRRLIPAIAMLLVSAVMLSTASFAWFTMNSQVTASGMQIQAKASGSLIIDTKELNFASSTTSADIYTKNEKLMPVTFNTVQEQNQAGESVNVEAWRAPAADAEIDPATGLFKGDATWAKIDSATGYIVEEELWIGSAGEVLENQYITIDLAALVAPATAATYAYAANIYVVEQANGAWAPVAHHAKPTATVYVDTRNDRNTVTLTNNENGYTIPSILGVGAEGDGKTTGLKIVVRFYVDGALTALSDTIGEDGKNTAAVKTVVTGYGYNIVDKTNVETPFDPTKAYFKKNVGDNPATEAVETDYEWYTAISTEGMTEYPTYDVYTQTFVYDDVPYYYVNSDEVPSSGTALELSFTAADKPAN